MILGGFTKNIRFPVIRENHLCVVFRTFVSPIHSPWQELVSTEGACVPGLFSCDAVISHKTAAAPVSALTAFCNIVSVPVNKNAVACFANLDRDDIGLTVTDTHKPVLPIFILSGAPSACLRFHKNEKIACIRVYSREHHTAHA